MNDADALTGIYDYLTENVRGPVSFDDLLRSKIVYSVSAFDKLLHDIIRIGMVDIFSGNRPSTPKFLNEPIPLKVVEQLRSPAAPPSEIVFAQTIREKLKTLSFQDPEKVADGLSYIWSENQKWQKISAEMGDDEKTVRTTLKLIVSRRNAIVHEADIDMSAEAKRPIDRQSAGDVTRFLRNLGETIHRLVC
ncbi:HEPN domain-containing protein [Pandoraea sp. NPDC087047]|uniref:HEPN domain-containing protein n=1 Tax=Pandoraea sp. NPDC087047 TaxID=3364390 RepID=UPI0037F24AE5